MAEDPRMLVLNAVAVPAGPGRTLLVDQEDGRPVPTAINLRWSRSAPARVKCAFWVPVPDPADPETPAKAAVSEFRIEMN